MLRTLITGTVASLLIVPAAQVPAGAAPAPTSSTDPVAAIHELMTQKAAAGNQEQAVRQIQAKARVKKVTAKANKSKVKDGGTVKVTTWVKPKKKAPVALKLRKPDSKKWRLVQKKSTSKKGKATLSTKLTKVGDNRLRVTSGKQKSATLDITVRRDPTPGPGPGPNPDPDPNPGPGPDPGPDPGPGPNPQPDPKVNSVAATWPSGSPLQVDRKYDVAVNVDPNKSVAVHIQRKRDSGWDDLPGSATRTNDKGNGTAQLSVPDDGTARLRVVVDSSDVQSTPVDIAFSDAGDALYNVPVNLPDQPGVMVKAQEFPMNYPKLALPNPIDKSKGPLILPPIGNPAAGPPTCVTDPAIPQSDCKIPGRQYRVMYTTERWVPDSTGDGSVKGPPEAATALLMVPPNVANDAPIVAWAHPTLGQSDQCSVSRGTERIPMPGGGTGPGGMEINVTDMIFFLDQMLAKGYIVVMPDYLGIAVNGPTGNQKTYIVGPQEARDVFFAVEALHTDRKAGRGWPGVPQAGNRFVVMGHSQGGHAALWSGIKADDLYKRTAQRLLGVMAVAPATDINQLVNTLWNQQANWVLGPEVIQTWAGYLGGWALKNNVLSQAGMANALKYFDYCTTQAFAASAEFYPNGASAPGTPFMKDPNDPANQEAFYNWSKIFAKMTPTIQQGKSNSFPKDMPLLMASGTADQIVLSQANAAFQESFCAGGADMAAYWTPVATGIANPNPQVNSAFQAADHLNVLTFPFTDDVGGKTAQPQLVGGSLLEFTNDRFTGNGLPSDCGDKQKTHSAKNPFQNDIQTWYVFPRLDWGEGCSVLTPLKCKIPPAIDPTDEKFYLTGGDPALMMPSKPTPPGGQPTLNPPPSLGSIDINSLSQTGCGFQFKKTGSGLSTKYPTNPDCVQWGLYPYNELIYSDGKVDKTWGTYPFQPALVTAEAVGDSTGQATRQYTGASRIKVNVNPDKKKADYRVQIQKQTGNGWRTVTTTKTRGKADTVVINQPAGRYRAVLPAQAPHQRLVSDSVRLTS